MFLVLQLAFDDEVLSDILIIGRGHRYSLDEVTKVKEFSKQGLILGKIGFRIGRSSTAVCIIPKKVVTSTSFFPLSWPRNMTELHCLLVVRHVASGI